MRIGVVCSSNGSSFIAALNIIRKSGFKNEFAVLLDRETKLVEFCNKNNIYCRVIPIKSNDKFSIAAREFFTDEMQVKKIFFLFSRLITKELFQHISCINIHPSLLPNFPGFKAVETALKSDMKVFGTTVHEIDQTLDGGPVVAQIVSRKPINLNLILANRISYAQKVLAFLIAFEIYFLSEQETGNDTIYSLKNYFASPSLKNEKLLMNFIEFITIEGLL